MPKIRYRCECGIEIIADEKDLVKNSKGVYCNCPVCGKITTLFVHPLTAKLEDAEWTDGEFDGDEGL
jgi:hypothetical protein